MKKCKEWLAGLLACAILLGFLGWVAKLTTPKRHEYGATWDSFLAEPKNSIDVMFFGSSIVYCDVVPAVFWEQSGLSAYVNAGPEQTMAITLDYLRQSLKTQQPRAVFVECSGMVFRKYQQFTKVNVGLMPWGLPRLDATFRAAEPELWEGLLFPLSFYHDRWSILTADDCAVPAPDPLAGYTWLGEYSGRTPADGSPVTPSEEDWERNLRALDKIAALCRRKGIRLVLYRSDTAQLREEDWAAIRERYADAAGVQLLDCREYAAQIGAETGDYYDALHYNAAGAEKFSAFLGLWAKEHLSLPPDPELDAGLWAERLSEFRTRLLTPMQPKADRP